MKRTTLISLALLVAGWAFMSTGVRLSFFRVDVEDSDLVVVWESESEEDVDHYRLDRRTRFTNDNRFVEVAEIEPHGPNKLYRYRDVQIYKSADEVVEYELYVKYETGEVESLGYEEISYTPTAVRRTWGSIKAMFQ